MALESIECSAIIKSVKPVEGALTVCSEPKIDLSSTIEELLWKPTTVDIEKVYFVLSFEK